MKQYRLFNNATGWVVFIIAAVTYILTSEPTASLWDCSEFIATAFKLEVGHPPGAPLFMLVARIATLFAGSDVAMAARMVNYLSALASAFTILFLFWSITHIVKKLVIKNDSRSIPDLVIIMGSGIVGALAYTFSDTFWFSAVEGEVYASSSFFTAIVFWAILKWENVADEKYANRWIILIAYLMGLSIGVHLLNLLAIPAIVMVYYFKRFNVNWKGAIVALTISLLILAFVMYGIIQGLVRVASWFELLFVNSFGLPFNSGVLFYAIVIIGLIVLGIRYSIKKHKVILNTALLCITMIILGYTSFAAIVIRANVDTPIDENKPDNVFALLSYINREQYGERPLITGQYYSAPVVEVKEDGSLYAPGKASYEVVGSTYDVTYDSRFTTLFPRMYSSDPSHINVYKEWADINGHPVTVEENGQTKTLMVPTFGENLKFFLKYQVGHMYMRYFLWNFVGRQNDEQGSGGILKGNWISGINYIDNKIAGPQENLPPTLKNIPSRNVYYFLPFILGILGLMFLLDKNKRYFLITSLLFIMTGLAIVVYLNQTPLQPRERDYAYAGSFYVFALWIGIGVAALYSWIKHERTALLRSVLTSILCLVLVPGIMARENWNDHDRSGRYTARSYAFNYLNSCAPNAILFTFGDNDTFPLWYLQEVEGIRTDVRVVNTMLLNTDWYINQMKKKAYLSDPLPISMNYEQYKSSERNRVYLVDQIKDYIRLSDAIEFVASDNPQTKTIQGYNQRLDFIPGRKFTLAVDTSVIYKNGTVDRKNAKLVEKELNFTIKGNAIDKSQLITLDILAHNNWERPVYFATCNTEGSCGLDQYLQLEGFAYRLVPIKSNFSSMLDCGRVNTEVMYNNIMNKFDYGRMDAPDVYIDEFNNRTIEVMRYRNNFFRLAQSLVLENKKDSAIKVLDKCRQMVPPHKVHDDMFTIFLINGYYLAGDTLKAQNVLNTYYKTCISELDYYFSLRPGLRKLIDYDIRYNLEVLNQMLEISNQYKYALKSDLEKKITEYQTVYSQQN